VQSILPLTKRFNQPQPGTVAQPFAQRVTENSILLGKPVASKTWRDETDEDEAGQFTTSTGEDLAPVIKVINWNRDRAKERKHAGLTATTKSGKRRNSNWVSGFVNGRDDKAAKAKLDALKITLPATVTTKGK
jgi:hypothetical protein